MIPDHVILGLARIAGAWAIIIRALWVVVQITRHRDEWPCYGLPLHLAQKTLTGIGIFAWMSAMAEVYWLTTGAYSGVPTAATFANAAADFGALVISWVSISGVDQRSHGCGCTRMIGEKIMQILEAVREGRDDGR